MIGNGLGRFGRHALLATAILAASGAAEARPGNPAVAPPNSRPHGATYAEWSARHWQWMFSLPVAGHPAFDETGADAAAGQSGHVWYLAGVFNASGSATRTITVPTGTWLFFPIINIECSNVEPPPFYGGNEAELRACVSAVAYSDLAAELDGEPIGDLASYHVQSPVFTFTLPANNILGLPAGTTAISVSDGFYLMLHPLSAGWHDLHFTGTYPDFNFTLDITYHIHVVGGGH